MSFMDGSLFDVLEWHRDSGMCMGEELIATFMLLILAGLNNIHSQGLVHRDLKLYNVLVTKDGADVKIADFGYAAQLHAGRPQRNSRVGTVQYMAPEVVRMLPYGCRVDLWSAGMMCLEMANQQTPFSGRKLSDDTMMGLIVLKPHPALTQREDWSTEFADFIELCLSYYEANRLTAAELLEHPFIREKARDDRYIAERLAMAHP